MNIGIIGAGHIGGTLTRRLTALGHNVFVANSRGPETLAGLASETGAKPVDIHEAARSGEIVIVTIPEKNIATLPRDLFQGVPDDVIVIDTGNYYPQQRDGRIDGIEAGTTESGWVEQQLGRPVVKTFNNIYADHLLRLGRPAGDPQRIALPVAGDDSKAKQRVIELLDELGFDGVDAGTIDESWRQQPGTPVYATDHDVEGVKKALAEASTERKPEWRAAQAGANGG
jgi:8-hydroxy-5-deazaflavin:NADPH oxidoreductase